MDIRATYKKAAATSVKHPFLWAIAFIAIAVDLWAVYSYNATVTRLTVAVLTFAVLAILAEAALIYSYLQLHRGQKAGFVDSIMTAVTYIPQILALKIVPIILISGFIILLSILGPVTLITDNVAVRALVIGFISVLGLLILFFVQAWSFFSISELYTRDSSIGECFSHAWSTVWANKWTLFRVILPLIVLDLILVAGLVAAGAIAYDTTFFRVVSGDEADRAALLLGEGAGGSAGVEFTVNRLANSIMLMALKNRGIEFASLPSFITNQALAGALTAFVGLALLLIRTSVLTQTFLAVTENSAARANGLRTSFKKA